MQEKAEIRIPAIQSQDEIDQQMQGRYYHAPLRSQLHTSKDGKPLKSKIAEMYPQLTRKQRRQLLRDAVKQQAISNKR